MREEHRDTSWATMSCSLAVSKEINQQTQSRRILQSYPSNLSKWSRCTDVLLILTTPSIRKYSTRQQTETKRKTHLSSLFVIIIHFYYAIIILIIIKYL